MNPTQRLVRDCVVGVYAFVLVALCSGCASKDSPLLGEVTGVVTLNGKPVAGAGIEYIPQEPGKSVAYGKTDADGRYKMYFGQNRTGAFVGKNLVRIYSDDRVTIDGQHYERMEVFPPMYNVKSEQFVDVVAGKNEFDFHCESGKFKPRQVKGGGAGT